MYMIYAIVIILKIEGHSIEYVYVEFNNLNLKNKKLHTFIFNTYNSVLVINIFYFKKRKYGTLQVLSAFSNCSLALKLIVHQVFSSHNHYFCSK